MATNYVSVNTCGKMFTMASIIPSPTIGTSVRIAKVEESRAYSEALVEPLARLPTVDLVVRRPVDRDLDLLDVLLYILNGVEMSRF